MMWQYRIEHHQLVEVDVPPPVPGPGEVLVAIEAVSLNARDLGVMAGMYPVGERIIPLSDGAGVIRSCGAGVRDFSPGDRVASCFYPYWEEGPANADNHRTSLGCEQDGVLSELVCLPESAVVRAPDAYSAVESATLPCAALTAWSALFTEGRLSRGQHVVIQGTGGVAMFAIQFARYAGATITVISSSDDKLEKALEAGAHHTINYSRNPDWSQRVLDEVGPADLVLELAGAATFAQTMQCLAVGGRVSVIGVASGLEATLFIPNVLFRHAHLTGITVGHRSDFRVMNDTLSAAGIRPVIHHCYSRDQIRLAYEDMQRGGHVGKLVIDLT